MELTDSPYDDSPVQALADRTLRRADARAIVDAWQAVRSKAAVLLRQADQGGDWLHRLLRVGERVRELTGRSPDAALYLMMQTALREVDHYSADHALFCAVAAHLCAQWFEWPAAEADALVNAALTMNIAMSTEQDVLAQQMAPPSDEQRQRIAGHAEAGAALLEDAGVTDPLWIGVVRRHHEAAGAASQAAQPEAVVRLATLLQRIDVFTAKLSRRRSRGGVTATVAARDACLDGSGYPDPVGATLLRVLGLYPPGSYVRLVSGEIAVVVRRGAKAHAPIVAAVRRANGAVIGLPQARDTTLPSFAVVRSVAWGDANVASLHERVLAV